MATVLLLQISLSCCLFVFLLLLDTKDGGQTHWLLFLFHAGWFFLLHIILLIVDSFLFFLVFPIAIYLHCCFVPPKAQASHSLPLCDNQSIPWLACCCNKQHLQQAMTTTSNNCNKQQLQQATMAGTINNGHNKQWLQQSMTATSNNGHNNHKSTAGTAMQQHNTQQRLQQQQQASPTIVAVVAGTICLHCTR